MFIDERSKRKKVRAKTVGKVALAASLALVTTTALAADTPTISALANNLKNQFSSVVQLITAICYVAGVGFAAAGIMKFKQHKDNPTQVPLGGPVAMIFIAAALIWLPGIIAATGGSIFGSAGYDDQRSKATGVDPFATGSDSSSSSSGGTSSGG